MKSVFLILKMNFYFKGGSFAGFLMLIFTLAGLPASFGQSANLQSDFLSGNSVPHIIPEPVNIQVKTGRFVWDKDVVVFVDSKDRNLNKTVDFFLGHLNKVTGTNLKLKSNYAGSAKTFIIKLNRSPREEIGKEGYTLSVKKIAYYSLQTNHQVSFMGYKP